jgi:molybdate transport repressor ModE-like protein
MYKMSIKPQWFLTNRGETPRPLPVVLSLCAAVEESSNLAKACRQLGLSYRHAWGILRDAADVFGAPIVTMTRGRGAKLTPLGEKLLWADKRIAARLSPILETLASELEVELERALSHDASILRVSASHGFAVAALRDVLVEGEFAVELKYVGSQDALASLTRAECDMAGFHVPVGDVESAALNFYEPWIRAPDLRVIHLATRRQGLMVAPGNPKRIIGLKDLTRKHIRFVNRQTGSGTRILLDLLLKQEGMQGEGIVGYETSEYTHAAVAAYIASGMADTGFGIETAARNFKLDFVPIATERYFLACSRDALEAPNIKRVRAILESGEFKARVNKLPGYDATHCGEVTDAASAFASLKAKRPGRGAARGKR